MPTSMHPVPVDTDYGFNDRAQREKMLRYRNIYPELVIGSSFMARRIDLVANVPQLILDVERPKSFALVNVNIPNAEMIFIGPNENVSPQSGFPLSPAHGPLIFGVGENTKVWAMATDTMAIFILDMGL